MSSVGAALGTSVTVEVDGRTITVKPVEWESVVAKLEDFLIDQEVNKRLRPFEILHQRGHLTKEELVQKTIELTVEVDESGICAMDGPAMTAVFDDTKYVIAHKDSEVAEEKAKANALAVKSGIGIAKLVSLITGLTTADLKDIADHPQAKELMAKVVMMIRRSLPKSTGAAA